MNEKTDVAIVGAGQGGAMAAIALRQLKYEGRILMIGAEPDLPYERPALSKEYLAGDKAFEKLLLRPASAWAERKVDTKLGARVTHVDAAAHAVTTAGGDVIEYGKLIWATGGRPRKLTCGGHHLEGVHYVRDRGDVDKMRSELDGVDKVVVIGAGYIGLEAASVLRKKGKHVTVLEALDRVLARVAGAPLSRFFEAEHTAQGAEIRLRANVERLEERDGRVCGVRLANGEVLAADMVVVGIGIEPTSEPLHAPGQHGVLVDLECKTSLPDVYAIGDCAAHPNVHAHGKTVRLESIQNANDMAVIVAKSILGTLAPGERYDAIPWFWSNQYDLKLQTVGLFTDYDDLVVRGDPATRKFSVVYLRERKVIALDCVNLTKDYVQGKALIAKGHEVDKSKLANPEILLKDLV